MSKKVRMTRKEFNDMVTEMRELQEANREAYRIEKLVDAIKRELGDDWVHQAKWAAVKALADAESAEDAERAITQFVMDFEKEFRSFRLYGKWNEH